MSESNFGRLLRGSWRSVALGLALAALSAGCSSSSSTAAGACRSYCEKACDMLATCNASGVSAATCVDDCVRGTDPDQCDGQAADQYTCDELTGQHACADYCATLCKRAPSCGSFDEATCDAGCATSGAPVCNSAAVAARSCDQLKPELRDYEEIGSELKSGGGVSVATGGSFLTRYALCEKAEDCADSMACSLATNTCGPCTSNADCAQSYGKYLCTSAGTCLAVECISDGDCPGFGRAVCDLKTNKCVGCQRDEQCTAESFLSKCNTKTEVCVNCVTNADCSSDTPYCDPQIFFCTVQ